MSDEIDDPETYLDERYEGMGVEPWAHTDEGVPRVYEAEMDADNECNFRLTFLHQTPMDSPHEGWIVTYRLIGDGDKVNRRVGGTDPKVFDTLPVACEVAEEIVGDRLRERIKDHRGALEALESE